MQFPNAYIGYLIEFHGTQDYFECHELLEDYWKEVDPGNKQSHWVALILLAVSCYHHRRDNLIGAKKTNQKATNILLQTPATVISRLGLDYDALIQLMKAHALNIEKEKPFEPITLPIESEYLLELCKQTCHKKQVQWCDPKYQPTHFLINKHMLRDRTAVIQERDKQRLLKKHKKR